MIWLPASGILSLVLVFSWGFSHAFMRGGKDFAVFYEAWRLVLNGRGLDIYRVSPDRFLYSPGFAWALSPFGFFSFNTALALWGFVKLATLFYLIIKLSEPWIGKGRPRALVYGLSIWGCLLLTRPLLIDLEYGQVNLLILGACVWGLSNRAVKNTGITDVLRWATLAFVAVMKLFPLPLLLLPWVVTQGVSPKKLNRERFGILVGVGVGLLIPAISVGWVGISHLLQDWGAALLSRGLPLESHNQSFTALLHHYLSGGSTSVHSEAGHPVFLGYSWLSSLQISLLSLSWTLITIGIILGWIFSAPRHEFQKWTAIIVGLMIIPSHLVWKPYFVMGIPLAIWIIQEMAKFKRYTWLFGIIVLFACINLTGFDFVGHYLAPYFEAASLFLFAHLAMLGWVARSRGAV